MILKSKNMVHKHRRETLLGNRIYFARCELSRSRLVVCFAGELRTPEFLGTNGGAFAVEFSGQGL